MEIEFKVSTGYKIFYGFFSVFFFSAFLSIIIFAFSRLSTGQPLPLLFTATFTLFGSITTGGQLKRKIIVSPEKIVKINILGKKELSLSDIKYFKVGPRVIYITPVSNAYPKISLKNYSEFANYEDLIKWLSRYIKELDKDS